MIVLKNRDWLRDVNEGYEILIIWLDNAFIICAELNSIGHLYLV